MRSPPIATPMSMYTHMRVEMAGPVIPKPMAPPAEDMSHIASEMATVIEASCGDHEQA